MNTFLRSMLAISCCFSATVFASEYTEDDILHATFVAYQEPGVLSREYIVEMQQVLETAARDGNTLALLVVARKDASAGGWAQEISLATATDQP